MVASAAATLRLGEGAAPSPLPTGAATLYCDSSDGLLYYVDSNGVIVGPLSAGGGGGGGITADNVLYVQDPANGGNDSTGTRGDSTKPFEKIAAALAAAQDGDVILIGTGTFDGPYDINDFLINPSLKDITLIGAGTNNTFVKNLSNACFQISYGSHPVKWERFVLKGMTLIGNLGLSALIVDGGSYGENFLPGPSTSPGGTVPKTGCYIYDIDVTVDSSFTGAALNFSSLGFVKLERVRSAENYQVSIIATNCRTAQFKDCAAYYHYVSVYAGSGAPTLGTATALMENCEVYDQLVVDNHPVLTVRDTYINTLFSNVIDYSGIYTLSLKVYGGEIDTIDLSQILDSGIVQVGLEFFGVTIGSASFGVSPVSGNRQQALLAGCAVGSLTVYECVDVKAMSSAFPLGAAASISTPQALPNGGTVVPPTFAISPTSFAGSQTLVLTLPFNLYSTNYVFAVEGNQIADLPIAVDSKGQTSITVKSSNGAPNGTVGGILQMY